MATRVFSAGGWGRGSRVQQKERETGGGNKGGDALGINMVKVLKTPSDLARAGLLKRKSPKTLR